jgi:putative solute:sodium symporter small subunit
VISTAPLDYARAVWAWYELERCGRRGGERTKSLGDRPMERSRQERYWRRNVVYVAVLLAIWALVSYGASILWVDWLDSMSVAGIPLGFWFANQGSMLTFVVLIFVYVKLMNDLDRKYGVYER